MQGPALFARLEEALESPLQGVTAQVRSLCSALSAKATLVFPTISVSHAPLGQHGLAWCCLQQASIKASKRQLEPQPRAVALCGPAGSGVGGLAHAMAARRLESTGGAISNTSCPAQVPCSYTR